MIGSTVVCVNSKVPYFLRLLSLAKGVRVVIFHHAWRNVFNARAAADI